MWERCARRPGAPATARPAARPARGRAAPRAAPPPPAHGRLTGQFGSSSLNLGFLSAFTRRFAPLEGQVRLDGRLAGTTANPIVEASLSSSGVQVAGTPLTDVAAELAYV